MEKSPEIKLIGLAALLGCLVAANSQVFGVELFGIYLYWIARILFEAGIILGSLKLIEAYAPSLNRWPKIGIAVAVSLVPFVMVVTALDIILGLPELELETRGVGGTRLKEFALETLYLLDNHICLGVIIGVLIAPLNTPSVGETAIDTSPSLLTALDPPLAGVVLWVEAQEHYVRVTTTEETRMVLNRFSDVITSLPEADGMQVHRSHWVAFSAIADRYRDGANLRLRLTTDESIPVSRSHRQAVEALALG